MVEQVAYLVLSAEGWRLGDTSVYACMCTCSTAQAAARFVCFSLTSLSRPTSPGWVPHACAVIYCIVCLLCTGGSHAPSAPRLTDVHSLVVLPHGQLVWSSCDSPAHTDNMPKGGCGRTCADRSDTLCCVSGCVKTLPCAEQKTGCSSGVLVTSTVCCVFVVLCCLQAAVPTP